MPMPDAPAKRYEHVSMVSNLSKIVNYKSYFVKFAPKNPYGIMVSALKRKRFGIDVILYQLD